MYIATVSAPSLRKVLPVCTPATRLILDTIQRANGTTGKVPNDNEVCAAAEQRLIEIYVMRATAQLHLLFFDFGEDATQQLLDKAFKTARVAIEGVSLSNGAITVNIPASSAEQQTPQGTGVVLNIPAIEDGLARHRVEELMVLHWLVEAGIKHSRLQSVRRACAESVCDLLDLARPIDAFDIANYGFSADYSTPHDIADWLLIRQRNLTGAGMARALFPGWGYFGIEKERLATLKEHMARNWALAPSLPNEQGPTPH
ncbi:MAG: hypothetical protein H7244_02650 [Herminiimonas sp.]|nr:hypothetical protein [Herminiimonas sp.]